MAEGARQERTDYMREKQREHRARQAAKKEGSKTVRTRHVPLKPPRELPPPDEDPGQFPRDIQTPHPTENDHAYIDVSAQI